MREDDREEYNEMMERRIMVQLVPLPVQRTSWNSISYNQDQPVQSYDKIKWIPRVYLESVWWNQWLSSRWRNIMPSFSSVAAEIRYKPECLPTISEFALVRALSSMETDVFSPSPCPLESHVAALPFPGAHKWSIILVNTLMMCCISMRAKSFLTSLNRTTVPFVKRKFSSRAKTHRTAFNITFQGPAFIFFDKKISGSSA